MRTEAINAKYNPALQLEGLKILLALEPVWTISLNGLEFQTVRAEEMRLDGQRIQCGKWRRRVEKLEWIRGGGIRIQGRLKLRSTIDVLTLYPGEKLPSVAAIRKRRRTFQREMGKALCQYFGEYREQKQILHSDRSHGVSGNYPRFLIGSRPVIAVDPDEDQAVVDGVLRSALLWSQATRKRVTMVTPQFRSETLTRRLARMPQAMVNLDWMLWDGNGLDHPAPEYLVPETEVHPYAEPDASLAAEVRKILQIAPALLRAVPTVGGTSVSVRMRGLEIAFVRSGETHYPLGEPLAGVIEQLAVARKHGSQHPLARSHQERWLESNIVDDIGRLLPSVNSAHIYPQVPSFTGTERNIIDLLTVTRQGRLVVMEVKVSPDPELPFQALDYWMAVEQHRVAGDFQAKGYFKGVEMADQSAILVLVAPLLSFHRTLGQLRKFLPPDLPMIEIGLNQTWKKEIQILHRQGLVS